MPKKTKHLFGFALSSPLSCPQKKTPFRAELDLYFIAGKPTLQEKATYRKTASFLGAVGASLVDLDNLFSSYTRVRQRPLVHSLNTQMQAIGKDRNNTDTVLWVKKEANFSVMWIYCIYGVLDSNGCMINLKDWKITEMLKIMNWPVMFKLHSIGLYLPNEPLHMVCVVNSCVC